MNELVSVIITTHNRLEMLKESVESVRLQTYRNIELIIVDDRSTDGTSEYLDILKTNSTIPIKFKSLCGEKKGGNYVRNVGIKMCEGKYIAFLDDDDYWENEKIQKQVDKIESNTKLGVVYCGFQRISNSKYVTTTRPNHFFKGDLSKKCFYGIFTVTSCIMIKRDLLLETKGFDEKLSHWQEYDLLIRCSQVMNIDFVDEILVTIRSDSYSENRLSNQIDGWKKSVSYMHKKYDDLIGDLDSEVLNSMQVNYYLDGASRYAAIKNKKMHRKYMKNAWKKSRLLKHFVRYVFNLTPLDIEKIKSITR